MEWRRISHSRQKTQWVILSSLCLWYHFLWQCSRFSVLSKRHFSGRVIIFAIVTNQMVWVYCWCVSLWIILEACCLHISVRTKEIPLPLSLSSFRIFLLLCINSCDISTNNTSKYRWTSHNKHQRQTLPTERQTLVSTEQHLVSTEHWTEMSKSCFFPGAADLNCTIGGQEVHSTIPFWHKNISLWILADSNVPANLAASQSGQK